MRQNNQKVESHFALLIFLKFIASVIPTVEFDMTGDLHFKWIKQNKTKNNQDKIPLSVDYVCKIEFVIFLFIKIT